MEDGIQVSLQDWNRYLEICIEGYNTYAPLIEGVSPDYELIKKEIIDKIVYNKPKPISPLKIFFLPFKENVVKQGKNHKKNLVIGVPSCDLSALDMLDEMYLNEPYVDSCYKQKREETILIGTDCFSTEGNCHCNVYGVKAYPTGNTDVSLAKIGSTISLFTKSEKGKGFLEKLKNQADWNAISEETLNSIYAFRKKTEEQLSTQNKNLPGSNETYTIVSEAEDAEWGEYSKTCVSCGACATICPTCTCFLLVDRKGFEKVRVIDACQYPGFTRIAAGEDQLASLWARFKNRYMCKYVWKPDKYNSLACTGCGRCIDACIGNINKNKFFIEQTRKVTT